MLRYASVLVLASFMLTACGKASVPPISPEKVFADTESAITAHYFEAPDAPPADFSKLYGAAIAALETQGAEKADRATLVKAIQAQGEAKVRERTYKALSSFLSALPGSNDFTRPEGLLLVEDKERQAGIGVLLTRQGPGRFLVLDTLEGSPAQLAGIKPGYVLKTIDGLEVKDMDIEEVAGRIRGKEGSTVKLTFLGGEAEPRRGKINLINYSNNTWSTSTGGQVEILSLRTALPGAADDLKNFLKKMGTRSAFVLDLRKLQQGDYEECFKIADLFVGKRKIGAMISKGSTREIQSDGDILFTGPIYVLVGKNSSAAADVLAAAIRSSLEVNLIGSDRPGLAYLTEHVMIDGGIQLHITRGVISDGDNYLLPRRAVKMDINVDDYLPVSPPGPKPSPEDPAHKQLMTMLGLK
ncbi:MAG: hypothetical protein JNM27_08095 [Leptospirales bacterium]|nr:hypothetical protein [Leptospirales bacterium]